MEENKYKIFSDRNIASILLISMAIQYVPIDGWQTSDVKSAISVLSLFFLISRSRYISKAVMLVFIYFSVLSIVYFTQFSGGELTIVHNLFYWITFCLFYNLVYHNRVYDSDSFIALIKVLIYIFTGVLVIQQIFITVGLKYAPVVNLYNMRYYSFIRLPSLTTEPSHTARVLVVCMYALLKLAEYKNGRALTIRELYYSYSRPLLCSLYTLLCIGSGTGIVGFMIVLLYFVKRQYSLAIVFVAIVTFFVSPYIDYEPLTRAMNVFDATLSGDFNEVKSVDNSASSRVGFIFGLKNYFDISDSKIWMGYGSVVFRTLATIDMYGFLVYIFLLLLVSVCCISDIQSFSFFVLLLGIDIRNFAYAFAMLMIMSAVKYFKQNRTQQ